MFKTADPHRSAGKVVGSGHCVALLQTELGVPLTATWRRGQQVRGGALERGTCIATFGPDGRYENDTRGASHAAYFLEETPDGILVVDQWVGKAGGVGERLIRFKNGAGPAVDDADRYYCIEAIA